VDICVLIPNKLAATKIAQVSATSKVDPYRVLNRQHLLAAARGRALFAEYIDDGMHVYELNSTIGHGAGPMKTLGLLQAGQRIAHAGVEISVSAVDTTGVFVTVSR